MTIQLVTETVIYSLLTSIHCLGMCGGLSLAAVSGGNSLSRLLFYHAGRILCCLATGFVLGLLGAAVSVNPYIQALLPLVCAVFILINAAQMFGIKGIAGNMLYSRLFSRLSQEHAPFAIGLLTALMPCGALQSVQLQALNSGSALYGLLTMLIFAVCTTPIPLGFGLLSSFLSAKFHSVANKIIALFMLYSAVKLAIKAFTLMGVL